LKYWGTICCCLALLSGASQSTVGLTGIPDTSFNIASEYRKHVPKYPQIRIVEAVKVEGVREKRNIPFAETGSRTLFLDAFYPSTKKKEKRTAIIILFGGGWRSGNRSLHHALAQKLAARGYACFTPDYRLSTEALYPAAVYDVKAAIRWVRLNAKKFQIDRSRVVIAGHSAGGELAAFMGSTNGMEKFEGNIGVRNTSSAVSAVINIDGTLAFIHPESGEGDDSKKISAATHWFGYPKTVNPALWKEASPLTHVGAYAAPILFLNSSVPRMHAGRDDYIRVLDKYWVQSSVKTFEDAPHSFCFFEPWFSPMVEEIDGFLKMVLAGR
jgi:pectinesterase